MLNKFLEEYVLKLYNNSNVNMSIEQRNLYSKEKYYILLKPVIEVLKKYLKYSKTINQLDSLSKEFQSAVILMVDALSKNNWYKLLHFYVIFFLRLTTPIENSFHSR